MRLIQILVKSLFKVIYLFAGFILSIIGIILPWRLRLIYLHLLEIGARIVLRNAIVIDFVKDQAFAQDSDKKLF